MLLGHYALMKALKCDAHIIASIEEYNLSIKCLQRTVVGCEKHLFTIRCMATVEMFEKN